MSIPPPHAAGYHHSRYTMHSGPSVGPSPQKWRQQKRKCSTGSESGKRLPRFRTLSQFRAVTSEASISATAPFHSELLCWTAQHQAAAATSATEDSTSTPVDPARRRSHWTTPASYSPALQTLIHSDDRLEFVAKLLCEWFARLSGKTLFITPISP